MGNRKSAPFWMAARHHTGSRGSGRERIGVSRHFHHTVLPTIWYENCYVGKENTCIIDRGHGISIQLGYSSPSTTFFAIHILLVIYLSSIELFFVTVHLWGAFPEVVRGTQCLYRPESQHALWASPAQQHVKCSPQGPPYGKWPCTDRHNSCEICVHCCIRYFISSRYYWIDFDVVCPLIAFHYFMVGLKFEDRQQSV